MVRLNRGNFKRRRSGGLRLCFGQHPGQERSGQNKWPEPLSCPSDFVRDTTAHDRLNHAQGHFLSHDVSRYPPCTRLGNWASQVLDETLHYRTLIRSDQGQTWSRRTTNSVTSYVDPISSGWTVPTRTNSRPSLSRQLAADRQYFQKVGRIDPVRSAKVRNPTRNLQEIMPSKGPCDS
jgi:hypothetical protein